MSLSELEKVGFGEAETLMPQTNKLTRGDSGHTLGEKRERPILMSGDNPRLIREGRKTQTRRLVKSSWQMLRLDFPDFQSEAIRKCPYGVLGDRLWVRETWAAPTCYDDEKPRDLPDTLAESGEIIYRAESPDYRVKELGSFWRSPYHMPRWASRITLEILKVRVERLQDISEEDARAEGVEAQRVGYCSDGRFGGKKVGGHDSYIETFGELWDLLHGKGAWDKNPWVWVIEFKLIEPTPESTDGFNLVGKAFP